MKVRVGIKAGSQSRNPSGKSESEPKQEFRVGIQAGSQSRNQSWKSQSKPKLEVRIVIKAVEVRVGAQAGSLSRYSKWKCKLPSRSLTLANIRHNTHKSKKQSKTEPCLDEGHCRNRTGKQMNEFDIF